MGNVIRLVVVATPPPEFSLQEQLANLGATVQAALRRHEWPLAVTRQTVFLREAADEPACRAFFAAAEPLASALHQFVVQPPANGARVALEAWAIGGPGVSVTAALPQVRAVSYDGLRWLHTTGTRHRTDRAGAFAAATRAFQETSDLLAAADMNWENVVRTWWQLGGITDNRDGLQNYRELNRARAAAFRDRHFGAQSPPAYPASTAIGMAVGSGLQLATLALQTRRTDVTLLPLENPRQTPAYNYAACYSADSPKFSRAMALVTPDCLTVWISGTASIIRSEVVHPGDAAAQTGQTLDHIANLLARENFARHGQPDAGATLDDLVKVRVYVKRAGDVAACRAVCARRLGDVPAVYVLADVCRPELLVEIEGVAFAARKVNA